MWFSLKTLSRIVMCDNMAEPVKFKLNNFDLKKLFSDSFVEELSSLNFNPVSLVLIKEEKDTDVKKVRVSLISLGYEKSPDLEQKIGYIEGNDTTSLNKLINFLESR